MVVQVPVMVALALCVASCVLAVLRRGALATALASGVPVALFVLACIRGFGSAWNCLVPLVFVAVVMLVLRKAGDRGGSLCLLTPVVALLSLGIYLRLAEMASYETLGLSLMLGGTRWTLIAALLLVVFERSSHREAMTGRLVWTSLVVLVLSGVLQFALLRSLGWFWSLGHLSMLADLAIPAAAVVVGWVMSLDEEHDGRRALSAMLVGFFVMLAAQGSGFAIASALCVIAGGCLSGRGPRRWRLAVLVPVVLMLALAAYPRYYRLYTWLEYLAGGARYEGIGFDLVTFHGVLASAPVIGGGEVPIGVSSLIDMTRGFVLSEVSCAFGLMGVVAVLVCIAALVVAGVRIVRDAEPAGELPRDLAITSLTAIVGPMLLSVLGVTGLLPVAPAFPLLSVGWTSHFSSLILVEVLVCTRGTVLDGHRTDLPVWRDGEALRRKSVIR